MPFELDRYYQHTDGGLIHVLGKVRSAALDWCWIAEQLDLTPVFLPLRPPPGWQESDYETWTAALRAPLPEEAAPEPERAASSAVVRPPASQGYVASDSVEFLHPADHPPEHGSKMLLYMYPWGVTIVGQWQGSGATLWAPLPKVEPVMRERLEREHEARRQLRLQGGGSSPPPQ